MAVTKKQTDAAGGAVANVLYLVVDGIPNTQQIGEIVASLVAALQPIAAIGIPKENTEAVLRNVFAATLNRINELRNPLPLE